MARINRGFGNAFSGRSNYRRTGWLCVSLFSLSCCFARRQVDIGFSHLSWNGSTADAYVVNTRNSRIGVYLSNSKGTAIGSFANLQDYYELKGTKLAFATNGGMFHPDYQPVGLLVQEGVERSPINLNGGDGNFFLKPNGVFLISSDNTAAVVRSEKFPHLRGVKSATQSGPLLVIDGKINPAFRAGSANRFVRSGVGVIDSHMVVFAVSSQPVNFWDFAHLFRDRLKCKNALYLDGAISQFFLPGRGEAAQRERFGVLIGVAENP
jgi:uncharacterized protein YigE (DUF2233 family)